MNDAEEIAKAIQESAKLGEKGLEVADKLGGFIAKVFKEPISEVSGIIHDKLRFIRWKRLVIMSNEVNQILADRGVEQTTAVPPKIALPIFEDSSLEDDPDIHKLWNNLLANAMDPSFNDEIRYGYIDMIKGITGVEATLLDRFYTVLRNSEQVYPLEQLHQYSISKEQFMQLLDLSADQYAIAANNLMRLQLISPAILKGGIKMGPEPITIYKGIDAVTLTPLGVKFIEACIA